MKFADRLFNMAKSGQAFLHRHGDKTIVIVPFGPYAGTWHYFKTVKRVRWEPRWLLHYSPTVAISPSGKDKKFALPAEVYSLHGAKHPGRLHRQFRHSLGLATARWKALAARYATHFAQLVANSNLSPERSISNYNGFVVACSYAMPLALSALAKDRELAIAKFKFLSENTNILFHLSPSRRQRLVKRVLSSDIESALKATFRATDSKVINDFMVSKNFMWYGRSEVDYMYLQSNNGSVSRESFKEISYCISAIRGHKKFRTLSVKLWKD